MDPEMRRLTVRNTAPTLQIVFHVKERNQSYLSPQYFISRTQIMELSHPNNLPRLSNVSGWLSYSKAFYTWKMHLYGET